MSAIANIAIQDGQGTPITHTFYPIQSGASSYWRENAVGLPLIGQSTVTMTVKEDKKSGLNRVVGVMQLPALETATGANAAGYTAAPKVGYINSFKFEYILPARGTAAQRKDLRVLAMDLFTDPQFIDAVENLNSPF
jgi:hypothetical protein